MIPLIGLILFLTIPTQASDNFLITRVIDGDTIVLSDGQKVRYIGVNAPETKRTDKITKALGERARAYNESLVLGRQVHVEFSSQQKDRYGRTLAYVYIGDTLINAEMILAGYASASYPQFNPKYAVLFKRLEQEARFAKRGLWACE